MNGNLLQSVCSSSQLLPVCFDNVDNANCFSPDEQLIDLMAASNCGSNNYWSNSKCSLLQHVFSYKGDGEYAGQGLKVRNETDKIVSWEQSSEIPRGPNQAFYALCAYILPTTTTTTTTTPTGCTWSLSALTDG